MAVLRKILLRCLVVTSLFMISGTQARAQDESMPSTAAGRHLEAWVVAHNSGHPSSLETWIRSAYSPEKLKSLDLEAQVQFYSAVVGDFPKIHPKPYEVVIDKEHRAVIQFLDAELPLGVQDPDPTRVLVVEIDVDPAHPEYLARGLGLGALICETKK